MRVESLDHVALYVRDLRRAESFYRDVLGLERRHEETWGDHPVVLGAGATTLALFPARGSAAAPPPTERVPGRFAHLAFRVSRAGLGDAMAELQERKIPFEEQDHTISRSIYFDDPDGHQVEITTYEV